MILVRIPEPADPAWKDWMRRAKEAREALIRHVKAGGRPEINRDLYTEQKQLLLSAFHHKCAYCETHLSRMRDGDIEHFRPKLAVTDAQDKPVMVDTGTSKHQHPGYYWLAYDWDNLLPSCITCNQASTGPGGEALGKRNRFPVRSNFWAHEPDEEQREQPLLLNPKKDDPARHFLFEATGVIIGLTEEAEQCIKIFDLNRDELISERKDAFEGAIYAFRAFVDAVKQNDIVGQSKLRERLERIASGAVPYAAFAITAYTEEYSSFTKAISSAPLPSRTSSSPSTPSGTSPPRVSGTA